MAVRKNLKKLDIAVFEKELLSALQRDPEHQFAFDGKMNIFSSRYNCTIKAVNVLWDEKQKDIVLVGAFIQGQPVWDMSKGYPVAKSEIAIPFRECFNDLEKHPGSEGMMLVSKTRKSVMEKCLAYPMRLVQGDGLSHANEFRMNDFDDVCVRMHDDREFHGKVSYAPDTGEFSLVGERGNIPLSSLSLRDMQVIGDMLLYTHRLYCEARDVFASMYNSKVPEHQTQSSREVLEGEVAGLMAVYDAGFPMRVCHAVAKTYTKEFKSSFNEVLHKKHDIERMIENYREKKGRFGEYPDKHVTKIKLS